MAVSQRRHSAGTMPGPPGGARKPARWGLPPRLLHSRQRPEPRGLGRTNMAEALRVDEWPNLSHPAVVFGFTGWPDAAEVGSGALAFLVKTLGATRFASLDPEPFFMFGQSRPSV